MNISDLRSYYIAPSKRGQLTAKAKAAAVKTAIRKYSDAHQALFGVPIGVTYDGTYCHIVGNSQGVTLSRLNQMTTQLKRRTHK